MSRAALVAEVRSVLDTAVPHGAAVLLAVSGGPDSVAMAHLVAEARPDLRAAMAHIRHGLRDDAEDVTAAAAHAEALGMRLHVRQVRVDSSEGGPEAGARVARYAALARIARTANAGFVIVGHTAEDQAETLLLRIARGTGLRGLAGMASVRPLEGDLRIVRPLLRVRRPDVRAFVAGEGLTAVTDPTNDDPQQRRARARHGLLPALAELAGPGDPVGALTRLADLAREDAAALDDLALAHARRVISVWGPIRAARTAELTALPPALGGRVVALMLAGVRGGGVTADEIISLARLDAASTREVLALTPGQALHVAGGAWVTCGGGWTAAAPADLSPLERRLLAVPGSTLLPEIGLCLRAEFPWQESGGQGRLDLAVTAGPRLAEAHIEAPAPLAALPPRSTGMASPAWAVLPDDLREGLAVRARRDGDRLRLSGGRRKLQDLFVDHGVPRAARDVVPIVVDASDEPVWIPGVALRAFDGRVPASVRLWLAPDRLV